METEHCSIETVKIIKYYLCAAVHLMCKNGDDEELRQKYAPKTTDKMVRLECCLRMMIDAELFVISCFSSATRNPQVNY